MNPFIRPTKEDLQQLSHAQLVDLVLTLFDGIEQLSTRVTDLEAQLGKNSKNSHKPPSSDGLKRPTSPTPSDRAAPQRGQPGHTQSCHASINPVDFEAQALAS